MLTTKGLFVMHVVLFVWYIIFGALKLFAITLFYHAGTLVIMEAHVPSIPKYKQNPLALGPDSLETPKSRSKMPGDRSNLGKVARKCPGAARKRGKSLENAWELLENPESRPKTPKSLSLQS